MSFKKEEVFYPPPPPLPSPYGGPPNWFSKMEVKIVLIYYVTVATVYYNCQQADSQLLQQSDCVTYWTANAMLRMSCDHVCLCRDHLGTKCNNGRTTCDPVGTIGDHV
jgi:hypothetical protein